MDLQLDGKVCLVTGASAGIGVGIARVLARWQASCRHHPATRSAASAGKRDRDGYRQISAGASRAVAPDACKIQLRQRTLDTSVMR